MSTDTTFSSDKKRVSLKNLFLDPNNYRFIDNKHYRRVAKDDITNDQVQKRSLNFLVGEKEKGIEDLLKSFKANGFLAVDQIQVEALGEGKYRVLEGNRRVAALKVLHEQWTTQHVDLENFNSDLFSNVPIITYETSNKGEHEVIMGLKHISGNVKWPPLNQAQLIFDLIHQYGWAEEKTCDSLAITVHELRRSLRAISLINFYRTSDYKDQFETEMFGIFREAISSTNIKLWIDWDDHERTPKHTINTDRFFSWLSKTSQIDQNDDGEEITIVREPIITKSTEISTLAKIIFDEQALQELETKRNILDAYSASSAVGDDKYTKALLNIEQNIEDAGQFAKYAKKVDEQKLVDLRNKIDGLLVSQGHRGIVINHGTAQRMLIEYRTDQFSTVTLSHYKGFKRDLEIKNLGRINLFAGENNTGKTSLLEAVYLLANQNDPRALLELYRRRGKFTEKLSTEWFAKEFSPFKCEGKFDSKLLKVKAEMKSEEDTHFEKSDYLRSLLISAQFNHDKPSETKVRLFNQKDMEQYFEEIRVVCATSFSSPFTMLSHEQINECHAISVARGSYDEIVGFMREYVDTKLKAITKVGDRNEMRFLVTHQDFEQPVDLAQFGEGIQRVFYISLQIAAAQNGVMCIDEVENAIHHTLLVRFTRFVQVLSEKFNVQLFITTHSNECIRAFFENGYHNEDIVGYRLFSTPEGVRYKAAKGLALQHEIENFNLDLRG